MSAPEKPYVRGTIEVLGGKVLDGASCHRGVGEIVLEHLWVGFVRRIPDSYRVIGCDV